MEKYVGFVRFKRFLNKNQEITIKHGEILQKQCFYNGHLGTANAIVKYKRDGEKRIHEPKINFFRFSLCFN